MHNETSMKYERLEQHTKLALVNQANCQRKMFFGTRQNEMWQGGRMKEEEGRQTSRNKRQIKYDKKSYLCMFVYYAFLPPWQLSCALNLLALRFFFSALLFFFSPSLLFLVHLPPNLTVNQMFTLPCYY